MNPHIFGSSRFTKEIDSLSLPKFYREQAAENCFGDIDRDLQSLETSTSSEDDLSAEWIYDNEAPLYQEPSYNKSSNSSIDSHFATLTIASSLRVATHSSDQVRTSELRMFTTYPRQSSKPDSRKLPWV
ncbi:hypothetical protein ABW20_dc0108494 [Dactylellina cionopaga]|nr:hypothetical protein ABW20_dc0108494 [Dactylellina cionopaga]